MLQFQEQRIESALVQREKVATDLFDSPGDSVSMLRAEDFQSLQHHQSQGSLFHIGFLSHAPQPFGNQQKLATFSFWNTTGIVCVLEKDRKIEISSDQNYWREDD